MFNTLVIDVMSRTCFSFLTLLQRHKYVTYDIEQTMNNIWQIIRRDNNRSGLFATIYSYVGSEEQNYWNATVDIGGSIRLRRGYAFPLKVMRRPLRF